MKTVPTLPDQAGEPVAIDLPPRVIEQLFQAAGVSTYHPDGDQLEKLHEFARNVVAETLARIPDTAPTTGSVPVAEVESWTNGSYHRNYKIKWLQDVEAGAKLYAAPPVNAPAASVLSDAEIDALARKYFFSISYGVPQPDSWGEIHKLVRAALLAASMGGEPK